MSTYGTLLAMARRPRPAHEPSARALRADAERNRERILAAARDVFAERGLDAPLEAIAQRSGVGQATLYRRFPTRQDLLAAAFGPKLAAYTEATERALKDPDPWRGFCDYLTTITSMQQGDRGFRDILTQAFPDARELRAQQDRVYHGAAELIERAKATGRSPGTSLARRAAGARGERTCWQPRPFSSPLCIRLRGRGVLGSWLPARL